MFFVFVIIRRLHYSSKLSLETLYTCFLLLFYWKAEKYKSWWYLLNLYLIFLFFFSFALALLTIWSETEGYHSYLKGFINRHENICHYCLGIDCSHRFLFWTGRSYQATFSNLDWILGQEEESLWFRNQLHWLSKISIRLTWLLNVCTMCYIWVELEGLGKMWVLAIVIFLLSIISFVSIWNIEYCFFLLNCATSLIKPSDSI